MYLSRVSYYGGVPDLARSTKEADALVREREPHEALVERVQVERQGGFHVLVRLVPAFARRTKVAGKAVEVAP